MLTLRPYGPRRSFPPPVVESAAALREHLLERISPDGALRSPCDARVLETVLAFTLLRRVGGHSCAFDRLADHLRLRRDRCDPLDRILISAALDGRPAHSPLLVQQFLAQVPGFTSARKQILLKTLLCLLGATPIDADPVEPPTHGLHAWAAVQMAALGVIRNALAGRLDRVRDEDVRLLHSTQRTPWIWEGNLHIHLWVLHALARLPGTTRAVDRGIRKLLTHQRADGGIPFVTDTDIWCTATAGVALSSSGAPTGTLRTIADHLARRQRPDGGWAYTPKARQTDADDISVCLEFLQRTDPVHYHRPIERGLTALLRLRGADGGFPTYNAAAPSEPCMTAAACNALAPQKARYAGLIRDAVTFLTAQQLPDGGFPPDWSRSRLHTVFRAVLAVRNNGAPAGPPIDRALRLVRDMRNADGGWGHHTGRPSDAISTAYALIILSGQPPGPMITDGVRYLLSTQQSDGGMHSVPDSIGPRPFTFRVAALADIFPLLALGHLSACPEAEGGAN
ncbi:prenyltransferase/squalene oxidase repeat-containing protein [Nonomuraea sp. NPDC002799]